MAMPTTNMKKGWIFRTSYDKKNHDIAPMMIQIKWWSRSSDDDQWWSKSSDDPDPVMMSHDDPDQEMIQIQRMNMTWRRRWLEDSEDLRCRWRDDPIDTEKKTSAKKLCQKNTFLVKRECWCICNFEMYSLILYLNFPIRRIICISLYPRCSYREIH